MTKHERSGADDGPQKVKNVFSMDSPDFRYMVRNESFRKDEG